jgi:hypothetical protein
LKVSNILSQTSAYIEVELKLVEQLTDTTLFDYSKLKIRKHEKIRKIFGNVTHHIDLDNSYTAFGDLFTKQGGEYRKLPYRLPEAKLCDFYQNDKFYYKEMCKFSTFPYPSECPVKKVRNFSAMVQK